MWLTWYLQIPTKSLNHSISCTQSDPNPTSFLLKLIQAHFWKGKCLIWLPLKSFYIKNLALINDSRREHPFDTFQLLCYFFILNLNLNLVPVTRKFNCILHYVKQNTFINLPVGTYTCLLIRSFVWWHRKALDINFKALLLNSDLKWLQEI